MEPVSDSDSVSIDEIAIPASMDAADAADFAAMVDIRNAIETDTMGTDALNYSARELLPHYRMQHDPQRPFVARIDGRIVGRGVMSWSTADDAQATWINVEVLPAFRRRGVGTALFDHLRALAAESGRPLLHAEAVHSPPDAESRVEAASGHGYLSANDPGVRFLLGRGFQLEQVSRISTLALPVPADDLARRRAAAQSAAGDDYRVVEWTGQVPDAWIDDLAVIKAHMSTDEPSAGLDAPEEVWDAARVRSWSDELATGGQTMLTVGIEHTPSGRLVGLNELAIPADRSRPVVQWDTLVLAEHRGHRLGTLMKVANLQVLARISPASPLVYTFNAEENRPMLDVNEGMGFQAIGYEGAWRATL